MSVGPLPASRASSTRAGPLNASSGKTSLGAPSIRTCSGASACVPTWKLVVTFPTFTLAPDAMLHAQPQEKGVSPGHSGVPAPIAIVMS